MKKVAFVIAAAMLVFGLVLAACSDKNKDEDEPKFNGFTLTVTGLPDAGSGKIYGASLLDSATSQTPLAIGVPNNKVFSFYHPSEANPQYPGNTEFTTPGKYILAIAITSFSNPTDYEAIYDYTKGTVDYSGKKDITVQWSDFKKR